MDLSGAHEPSRFGDAIAPAAFMHDDRRPAPDQRLQSLDVHIVDVLAHLESLLRASHSIQRALLALRTEAPPPSLTPLQQSFTVLRDNVNNMRHDCQMLAGIVEDLMAGIDALADQQS